MNSGLPKRCLSCLSSSEWLVTRLSNSDLKDGTIQKIAELVTKATGQILETATTKRHTLSLGIVRYKTVAA